MRGLERIRRAGPWLGWSVWLLAAASLTLVFALFVVRDDTLSATDRIGWLPGHLPAFAFVIVGAVIVSRRPGNVIGWLCCGIGLAQILAGFGGSSATGRQRRDGSRPVGNSRSSSASSAQDSSQHSSPSEYSTTQPGP